MRRLPLTTLLSVFLVGAVACGVPTDEEPVAIDNVLATAVPAETTPESPVSTEFPIYLVDGNRRMQEAKRLLPEPITITAVVMELIEEPTAEESDRGWVSQIPAETMFTDIAPFSEDGRAELDFVSGSLDTLERDDLTVALAQLVWTLTASESIEEIIIRIEGIDQAWPTDEEDSAEGQPLRFEDYDEFDPDFVEPTPTPGEVEPPAEDEPTAADGSGVDSQPTATPAGG